MKRNTRITLIVLLVVGAATWTVVAAILKKSGDLAFQPNALHLKGSPYGRTLALAMRGPADVYWHRGEGGDEHECGPGCDHESHDESAHDGCEHAGCDHDHGVCEHEGCDHDEGICEHDHEGCDHDHGVCDHEGCDHGDDGELAGHSDDGSGESADPGEALASLVDKLAAEHAEHEAEEHAAEDASGQGAGFEGVRPYLLDLIRDMRTAYHSRSNRRGESALHRAFVMGETERRLALSYEMDPTNIACYGSYFMFLSEALTRVTGSEGEERVIQARQQAALQLSNYTIRYCLRYPNEAPAMVTGAVAAHDYLQIQLSTPDPDLEEAEQVLRILDKCVGHYEAIREAMIEAGTWQNFPEHRRGDMESAFRLVTVLRDADRTVFKRLSGESVAVPDAPADGEMATR